LYVPYGTEVEYKTPIGPGFAATRVIASMFRDANGAVNRVAMVAAIDRIIFACVCAARAFFEVLFHGGR
jgi:hypothetical protein